MSTPATPAGPAPSAGIVEPECAGRFIAWAASVVAGHASVASACDAIEMGSSGHVVTGLPGGTVELAGGAVELSLPDALAWLREAAPQQLTMVLPTAGDPLGLSGAGALTQAALVAETAVVVNCADTSFGWVPERDVRGSSYVGVRWRGYPGSAIAPAVEVEPARIVEQADRALRRALREATDSLGGVDLARWRTEAVAGRDAADAALRSRVRALPSSWPAPARALGERALALWRVLRVAASDQGAVSASASLARGEALRALSQAVREAAMTAYNVPVAMLLDEHRR